MAALLDLPRPRVVAVSFWAWLAGSFLVGATVALASTKLDPMRAEFARLAGERDPDATAATIDRVADASVLVVIGTGGLLGLLGLTLAGAVLAGRGWARVLLAVVAIVGLAYVALTATAATEAMLGAVHTVVGAGLLAYAAVVLVALVCMFLPGTKAWFHRPKGR
jgi:hypothetical protein